MFKSVQVPKRDKIGTRPKQIPHPDSGEPEDAVRINYHFNNRSDHAGRDATRDLPEYRDEFGRPGNVLDVNVVVPKSVADEVRAAIAADPTAARELAEHLVLQRGGLLEEVWRNGVAPRNNPVRPPWERLPEGWQTHIVTPKPDADPRELPFDIQAVPVQRGPQQ